MLHVNRLALATSLLHTWKSSKRRVQRLAIPNPVSSKQQTYWAIRSGPHHIGPSIPHNESPITHSSFLFIWTLGCLSWLWWHLLLGLTCPHQYLFWMKQEPEVINFQLSPSWQSTSTACLTMASGCPSLIALCGSGCHLCQFSMKTQSISSSSSLTTHSLLTSSSRSLTRWLGTSIKAHFPHESSPATGICHSRTPRQWYPSHGALLGKWPPKHQRHLYQRVYSQHAETITGFKQPYTVLSRFSVSVCTPAVQLKLHTSGMLNKPEQQQLFPPLCCSVFWFAFASWM